MTTAAPTIRTTKGRPQTVDPTTRVALGLSWLLAAAALAASVATLTVPDLLSGTPVMNGSAMGTALVVLVIAVPILTIATRRAGAGSLRALVVATGITAYLLYNGVMFAFATPFNEAFLLYVAMLGLALWTLAAQSLAVWGRAGDLASGRAAVGAGVHLGWSSCSTATVWLARVLPATFDDDPSDWLAGTGLTTNPVIVQDLAFWLPVMAWLGWGAWKARPPAVALAAAGLVFWVVESPRRCRRPVVGPPGRPLVDLGVGGAVVMFAAMALVGLSRCCGCSAPCPRETDSRKRHERKVRRRS